MVLMPQSRKLSGDFFFSPNQAQKYQQELEGAQKENQQAKEKFQEVQNQLTQNQNQQTQVL